VLPLPEPRVGCELTCVAAPGRPERELLGASAASAPDAPGLGSASGARPGGAPAGPQRSLDARARRGVRLSSSCIVSTPGQASSDSVVGSAPPRAAAVSLVVAAAPSARSGARSLPQPASQLPVGLPGGLAGAASGGGRGLPTLDAPARAFGARIAPPSLVLMPGTGAAR